MNGGDFFALASETCLNNLGGETAPPSGCFSSMPIFPGVGPHVSGVRAPNRESQQRNPFYLWKFICTGLAASDLRLNKEPAVRVPTGSAHHRPRPHRSIGLARAPASGYVVNGQYFPSLGLGFLHLENGRIFPGHFWLFLVNLGEGVGPKASPPSRSTT